MIIDDISFIFLYFAYAVEKAYIDKSIFLGYNYVKSNKMNCSEQNNFVSLTT